MRAPRLFVSIGVATLVAACSKPKPQVDAALARDLDMALANQSSAVVSAVELGASAKDKPHAPAERQKAPVPKPTAHPKHPTVKAPAPSAPPAEVKQQVPEQTVAAAPAQEPAPTVVVTQTEPSPEPQPAHAGRGNWPELPGVGGGIGGGMGGGVGGMGGMGGGVIIIRGGGSGIDPCDERMPHGHGRMGRGGILYNPRTPSFGGGGLRGSWGGSR